MEINIPCRLQNMGFILALVLCILISSHSSAAASAGADDGQSNLKTYIVHVELPDGYVGPVSSNISSEDALESWYRSFLPETRTTNSDQPSRMVYSYRNVITGFAARLSPEEVKAMEEKEGFVAAYPEEFMSPQTTQSPSFLGLQQNAGLWRDTNYGEGLIIGVLDTGIMPDHISFNDAGMPRPPSRWTGRCEFSGTLRCNNKIIGARNFPRGPQPLDLSGHGTHVASTAAGNFVRGANVFGQASGTAVGIAPRAHLAIYHVCNERTSTGQLICGEGDILAGMEAAIDDRVDLLSISLGSTSTPFYRSSIAIGAFRAMQRGIFVSCSAGNRGPGGGTLSNEAPWLLTVGAGTINRSIRVTVRLGNQQELNGESLNQRYNFPTNFLRLVFPGQTGNSFCERGSFSNINIRGMVVLCRVGGNIGAIAKGQVVRDAGGAAMILVNSPNDAYSILAEAHVLPATRVSYADGERIIAYIRSTTNPTASLLSRGTIIEPNNAPMVASFSSRGPNLASPGILKPDIIGPGVNILAAWPTSVDGAPTRSTFNIISGTSMACPHLTGVATLLKKANPLWSPAVIKSAIMTTANQQNLQNNPIPNQRLVPADVFALGAGHVNPSRANDPGLVYDLQSNDYIPYLCGLRYTNQQINIITQRQVNCATISSIPEAQLNYPSFAITLASADQTYSRTVTNIGQARSTYTVNVVSPPGVRVTVRPSRLDFANVNQRLTYQVTFSRLTSGANIPPVQGSLTWISNRHTVRSPISVRFQ